MNSETQIRKFLFSLSEAFPGQVRPATLDLYLKVLDEKLRGKNLDKILKHFMQTNKFFPTCKEIVDLIEPQQECPRDKAVEFVDMMIAALQTSGNINWLVGEENYSFWKRTTNVDRFSISNGGIDPRFQRSAWIDMFERIFRGEQAPQLEARKSELQLAGTVIDFPEEGA